jgi:molecular chaperone HtpG
MDSQNTAQQYEFRAEVQQLLNILVHALYTDKEIFLRELLSNASDALNRLQFEQLTNSQVLDAEAELAIRIAVDAEAKTITISDSGIGMNQAELIENLGTIAHSGALAFMNAMKEKAAEKGSSATTDIIGQFGVGFYSVFMIADEVQVTSRSFRPEDRAYVWVSNGAGTFSIAEAEKPTRGTDIVIRLKADAEEFLSEGRLATIVAKHSNYVAFPIYQAEKVINARTALWRRSPREVSSDEYLEFYSQMTYDNGHPLLHVHLVADAPVQFYSLLYVPSKLDRGLLSADHNGGPKLYARKVLIQEHSKELLPEWMRFVEGVVDSEDLPLNISRETVQSNKVMARLKQTISNKVLSEIENLANKDADKYQRFWLEFGRMFKEGIVTDPTHRERLGGLLRFRTANHPEGWVSLGEYIAKMAEGQTDIFYLFGDDARAILRSPHLDAFKTRGIDVLLLTETIDSFMINGLATFEEKRLHNGADADLDLPPAPTDEAETADPISGDSLEALLGRFKNTLGEQVMDVRESKMLTGSPARLVAPDQGFGADMERVYRMLDQNFVLPKRILEINPRHAILRNLAAMGGDDPLATQIMEQLFESALLMEGIHPSPVDMLPRIQALMEAASRR